MRWFYVLLLPLLARSFSLPLRIPETVIVRNIVGSKADKIAKMNAYLKNLYHRGIQGEAVKASFLETHSAQDLNTIVFYDYLVDLTAKLYLDLYLKGDRQTESVNGYKVICVLSKQKGTLEQVMMKSRYEKILKKCRKVGCIVHEKILSEEQFKQLDCKTEPGSWTDITKTEDGYYKSYCLAGTGNITKNYHLCTSLAKKRENDDIRFIVTFE